MSANSHLEAAAAYIAVAESGDAKRVAYEKAADEILAAMAEDPTLTQHAVSMRIDKSGQWLSTLLRWRKSGSDSLPFARGEAQFRYVERKVPTQHEDRVKMAEELLRDPEVAKTVAKTITDPSTKAGRLIAQEVLTSDAQLRRKHREQTAQAKADGALPLPAYMAHMVEKMTEWANGLAAITSDDLAELPEGRGRELVADRARRLGDEAWRWVDELEPDKPGLRVIQGQLAREAVS